MPRHSCREYWKFLSNNNTTLCCYARSLPIINANNCPSCCFLSLIHRLCFSFILVQVNYSFIKGYTKNAFRSKKPFKHKVIHTKFLIASYCQNILVYSHETSSAVCLFTVNNTDFKDTLQYLLPRGSLNR